MKNLLSTTCLVLSFLLFLLVTSIESFVHSWSRWLNNNSSRLQPTESLLMIVATVYVYVLYLCVVQHRQDMLFKTVLH